MVYFNCNNRDAEDPSFALIKERNGYKMKKTIVKVLTITVGVIAALAAVAGVVYLIQKKSAAKSSKKYVSCPQDDTDMLDELEDTEVIEEYAEDVIPDAE